MTYQMVIANHLALVCLQTMPWLPAGLFSLRGRVPFPELPLLSVSELQGCLLPDLPRVALLPYLRCLSSASLPL